jgi:transcription elongation factor SPT6
VFDPAEIKARRLQDEDKVLAHRDIPERHQLLNSTLSDNPVLAPVTPFPPAHLAAAWAHTKISYRTQYLFCNMHADGSYPEPTMEKPNPFLEPRRPELSAEYNNAVIAAVDFMFHEGMEVPYLWHYKRDAFSVLQHQGRTSVQFLERDELWQLYTLGLRFRAIYERNQQVSSLWAKIQEAKPDVEDTYLTNTLLPTICMQSIESAAEGYDWLSLHYPTETRRIREDEITETKRPDRLGADNRLGPIMQLVKVRKRILVE